MKKLILGGFAIVLIVVIAYFVYGFFFGERVSPPDVAEFHNGGLDISIAYSRPSKKGRLIFGKKEDGALQPFGEYWRLGANEATKITVDQPVNILNNTLEAGSYAMYAVPGEQVWKIGFNSDWDRWGAFEPDYSKDICTAEVTPQQSEEVVEMLTISILDSESHSAEILVQWDQTEIRIPVDLQ